VIEESVRQRITKKLEPNTIIEKGGFEATDDQKMIKILQDLLESKELEIEVLRKKLLAYT